MIVLLFTDIKYLSNMCADFKEGGKTGVSGEKHSKYSRDYKNENRYSLTVINQFF